jgi:hypothetical protein
MKSALPSFWEAYASLDESIKRRARKAFRLWAQNPFHPSLRFKCINRCGVSLSRLLPRRLSFFVRRLNTLKTHIQKM